MSPITKEFQEVDGTESASNVLSAKITKVRIGKYEVKLLLTKDNKFIDVIEIGLDKQFIKKKENVPEQFHDIDDFYKE